MTRKINNSYALGQSNAPTTGGDMLKTRIDGTLVWEGVEDYTFVPRIWYGDRGVIAIGGPSYVNNIDYITITTTGNATDFGDLTVARNQASACSDGSTACFAGGRAGASGQYNATIDYITIATPGNATDFGDLSVGRQAGSGLSDGTRGLFAAGNAASGASNVIDYITIATTGNATDFGDLTVSVGNGLGSASNGTRGIWAGGWNNEVTIGYVIIDTTGNAVDFGDLTQWRYSMYGGCTSSTRAVFGASETASAGGYDNTLDYITMATTGNAADFGDLSVARYGAGLGSNNTRGVIAGGYNSVTTYLNAIEYITVDSLGNGADFGDLTASVNASGVTSGD